MMEKIIGTCKYCRQTVMVSADEVRKLQMTYDLTEEAAADMVASDTCGCPGASLQRKREEKTAAAGAWIENTFNGSEKTKELMAAAVVVVITCEVNSVSVKIGKRGYRVWLDSDQCIRIKTTFKDEDEESF